MRASILVWTLGICAAIQPLGAQAPQRIAAGAHVRVTVPEARLVRAVGRIVSFDCDSIVLVPDRDGTARRLATKSLRSLEVSRGRRRHIAAGVVLGYALMLGLGFAGHPGVPHTDAGPFLEGISYGILYGTPVALLGGILGASIRTERWERVEAGNDNFCQPGALRNRGGQAWLISR